MTQTNAMHKRSSKHHVAPRRPSEDRHAMPCYVLRACQHGPGDAELEVFQVPSTATPHLHEPLRVAGLRGRTLALFEPRILKRLKVAGVSLAGLGVREIKAVQAPLDEDTALVLGLLFRVLSPMRDRDRMRACAEGIDAMGREEAAYWLGMAMHRRNPRRVLMALRSLLTDPRR